MTSYKELRKRWLTDPKIKAEYDALEEEYSFASKLIQLRKSAGFTQAQLARVMETTQTAIARIESGKTDLKMSTVDRYAEATGHTVHFKPISDRKKKMNKRVGEAVTA